jgi:uncharacterized protein YbaR (Trm112 family)
MTNNTTAADLPQELLDILVCPLDKAKVQPQGMTLVCEKCGRAYPVRDGIPIMIIEEAQLPASNAEAGS